MGLTVSEALAKLSLSSDCVVAGGSGLDKIIHRVNVLEVPDIVQWLDGGELLLTTGFALKDNPQLQSQLLCELANKGIAALAIKSGRYLTPIPQPMLDLADELGLPLLELPAYLPLSRVMAPIYETLLNQQLEQLKQAEEIHHLFLEVILKGEGIAEIGNILTHLIKKHVVIFDTRFQILFQSFQEQEQEFAWKDIFEAFKRRLTHKYARAESRKILKMSIFHYKNYELFIFPVVGSKAPLGYIVVVRTEHSLTSQDSMACEQAALVAALEISKQKAVFEAERRSKGELLDELLRGNTTCAETLKRRANSLNFKLDNELVVFVVNWQKPLVLNKESIIFTVEELFQDYPGGVLWQFRCDQLIGLVGVNGTIDLLKRLLTELALQFGSGVKQKVWIGTGRAYNTLEAVHLSYEEARVAVAIGSAYSAGDPVTFFDQLGAFRCLYEIRDYPQIKLFYTETVGRLKEYDQINNAELLQTLEAYFQNGCNLRQTAKALFVHRNTLSYRLEKLERITGRKLDDYNDLFDLQLAVRLDKIIT